LQKIYILPVPQKLQPSGQPFRYPQHNRDYGIEQDFLRYMKKSKDLLTSDPKEADWHYLPVFWTRYGLNVKYRKLGSFKELKQEVGKIIIDDEKTFTICQHKDAPFFPMGKTTLFLASRKGKEGIDVPLLSSPHSLPKTIPAKKYLASFVGKLDNHPIRRGLYRHLRNRKDTFIFNGTRGEKFFVNKILESYLSLCPRGHGGSSFRFFESLQLGVPPLLIGDIDTRPFKKYIDWEKVSLFTSNVKNVNKILDQLDRKELLLMGKRAAKLWKEKLTYQRWCHLVLRELEDLK
jgi:hypothetical protein